MLVAVAQVESQMTPTARSSADARGPDPFDADAFATAIAAALR